MALSEVWKLQDAPATDHQKKSHPIKLFPQSLVSHFPSATPKDRPVFCAVLSKPSPSCRFVFHRQSSSSGYGLKKINRHIHHMPLSLLGSKNEFFMAQANVALEQKNRRTVIRF